MDEEADVLTRPEKWCISYNQLMQVDEQASDLWGDDYEDKSMRDICSQIIIPKCNETGTSYALSLNPNGLDIGAFISHSWDGHFADFVEAIRCAFQTWPRQPNLWICAFALRQSDDDTVIENQIGMGEEALLETPFAKAITKAPSFVVVRNSNMDIFTRIWCVCELFYANQLELFPDKTYISGPNNFKDLKTSCLDAQSTRKADRFRIIGELMKNQGDAEKVDDIMQEFRIHRAVAGPMDGKHRPSLPELRSNEQVQERFVPIFKREGKIYRKTETAFVRKAVKGEHITTEIAGVLESEVTAKDSNSWVVCAKACFERYIITNESFQDNYKQDSAKPISSSTGSSLPLYLARLKNEGYKEYESKRRVWAHQVDEDDMEFFLANVEKRNKPYTYFMAPWGTPARVEKGDYIVTKFPEANDGINRVERTVFEHTYAEELEEEDKKETGVNATVVAIAAGALLAVLFTVSTYWRRDNRLRDVR